MKFYIGEANVEIETNPTDCIPRSDSNLVMVSTRVLGTFSLVLRCTLTVYFKLPRASSIPSLSSITTRQL